MPLTFYFKGRKIDQQQLAILSDCFGEKIDDMRLCRAIILDIMKPKNTLARGAFTRALTTGRCDYTEGGRAAKETIRRMRRKLGYAGILSVVLVWLTA